MTVSKLRPSIKNKAPDLSVEKRLWDAGKTVVVGMDEVGRGAWAGPLTVGAGLWLWYSSKRAQRRRDEIRKAGGRPTRSSG